MLIVLPSDPTTLQAADYLAAQGISHQVIPIPGTLGYKTGANNALYIPGSEHSHMMRQLSSQGFVIMRIFKDFEPTP